MDVLAIWLLYAAVGVTLFSILFVWAVRSGQFRDQGRARHLPLQDPHKDQEQEAREQERDEG